MTLTAGDTMGRSTLQLPWGTMEAVAGLRLGQAVDRRGDYVLFKMNEDYYVVLGPCDGPGDRVVSEWFGDGWGIRGEAIGDVAVGHIIRILPMSEYLEARRAR